MKRFSFVLAVILLVVLTACSPDYDRLAESPHEDPAQAPEFLDPLSLLRFYGSALDLAAAGKYQNAQDLLAELEQANIPDELSYIIDRYNELCRQLFSALDGLEPLLEEASALLDENRIDDAEQKLELAAALGDEAGLLVAEMTTVTADLGDSLGAIAELVSGELGLAHERLVDILGRLSQLLERLQQLRQGLIQAVAQARTVLIATELSLSITPASLFVGDSTTFYGRLTAASSGLGGRELTLLLDDRQQTVTTGPDGSYRATVAVPYNYVATMTAQALYTPTGNDAASYMAAASPPVVVNTLFYSGQLEVSAPEEAHPGLPAVVSGQFISGGGGALRTLKLWLDNELMAQEIIQGRFAIEITPSPELATGRHRLTLEVAPLGRYQGASMSLDFSISLIPAQVDIEMALFVVLPESLKVSGRVYHREGFLEDARVTLAFRDFLTTTRTASYGGFSATIEVPLDPFLFGLQELEVTVAPAEPWYAPLETTQRIIVINPAHIGLLLATLLSVGLLTYRRGRTGVADRPERGAASVKSRPDQPAAIPPRRRRYYDLSGINGRIILAYLDALTAVEKKTGITLAPQTTLREFLRAAAAAPPLAVPFAELTTLAEAAMYSGRQPDRDSAARAGRLADVIKKGGL